MNKMKVGIIGCGNISAAYMKNIPGYAHLELYACADIDVSRAQARAEEFAIPHAYTVEQLLGDPQVDIVINLTIPAVHAEVCIQILEAGKHAYVEKPLAVTREESRFRYHTVTKTQTVDLALRLWRRRSSQETAPHTVRMVS